MTEPVRIGDATLYLGDCLDILPTLGPVDAVVTDPPYGIEGSSGTINRLRGKGDYRSTFADSQEYVRIVCVRAIEWCKKNVGTVVLTPGNRNVDCYGSPDSFGAFYQPASVGMQKFGNADAQPVLYFGKNRRPNLGRRLSFMVTESPEKNGHPCVKPIRVWQRLIYETTLKGDTILDPFMGSGTTGVACANLGCKFIGIEIEPHYFEIACKRIKQAYAQPRLFEDKPKAVQFELENA